MEEKNLYVRYGPVKLGSQITYSWFVTPDGKRMYEVMPIQSYLDKKGAIAEAKNFCAKTKGFNKIAVYNQNGTFDHEMPI